LRKIVLLKWSIGAVSAGSVPGGAVGGARFGVLRLGEGRVPSRDYVGRGKAPVAGEASVGVGRGLVGRRGLGVERLGVRGLGVGGLGVGGLGVCVEWVSSRHRGLSRAMALHVAKSLGRSVRFSAFLSVRPKFISGHPIGRGCATQPVSNCRGTRFMGMRATWPDQRRTQLW
jgi:hypothetical protein